MMSEPQRRALYALVPAVIGVLTIYGVITQDQAAAWSALAVSTITCVVAFIHVPLSPAGKHAMPDDE